MWHWATDPVPAPAPVCVEDGIAFPTTYRDGVRVMPEDLDPP